MNSSDDIRHCVGKIQELVGRNANDPRSVLQLGYNLGRLSELTAQGRVIWDRWKEPVGSWDQPMLLALANELCLLIPSDKD